jgi:hypothetical protein
MDERLALLSDLRELRAQPGAAERRPDAALGTCTRGTRRAQATSSSRTLDCMRTNYALDDPPVSEG